MKLEFDENERSILMASFNLYYDRIKELQKEHLNNIVFQKEKGKILDLAKRVFEAK